jgi:hypothetical protein
MTTRKTAEPLSSTDPQAAAAAIQGIMEAADTEFPEAPVPEDNSVDLPAGLLVNGVLATKAYVRELNGADEEKIFRALVARNLFHLRQTIIECGAVQIGENPKKDTPRLLKQMIIGDLDAILFGIYKMTYGDRVEVKGWICPECADPEDIGFDVSEDIEVKRLVDIADAEFTVELRGGKSAVVRLPIGADQEATGDNPDRTIVERNTILLQRCIVEVIDENGRSKNLAAFPSYAKEMGIKDRRLVISAIAERQPGPQYNSIKFKHVSCGKEVTLGLDLADLFLG